MALPRSVFAGGPDKKTASTLLDGVGLQVHLNDRVESLTLAEKHLLEIAKAFAVEPKLLILDEPTAPLGGDAVDLLFRLVREAVAAGTSVVYITHRLAEVRELADRVTVLRDGRVRGTSSVGDISDSELLALIVGRQLDSTFPDKHTAEGPGEPNFVLDQLSGPGFVEVSASATRGEIIGVAGVVGNGQSELLRALAGQEPFTGVVEVEGTELSTRDLLHRSAYMPADRHARGTDDEPLRSGEQRALGAHQVQVRPLPEQTPRGGGRPDVLELPLGQGALHGRIRVRTVRRQPAEGRDLARPALRAARAGRGRADAGRRRRRPRGDLRNPARGFRAWSAGDRRVLGRQGARRTLRPGAGDVTRSRRGDPRRRRRDRGAHRLRRRDLDRRSGLRGRCAARGQRSGPAPFHPGRLHPDRPAPRCDGRRWRRTSPPATIATCRASTSPTCSPRPLPSGSSH